MYNEGKTRIVCNSNVESVESKSPAFINASPKKDLFREVRASIKAKMDEKPEEQKEQQPEEQKGDADLED